MDLEKEKGLVEQAKSDPRAFGLLYDAYFHPIYGYVLRRTANVATAQDITSEVFLKALSHIKSFHWQGVPFSAWLYRIASHEIANTFNGDGHRRMLTEELRELLEEDESALEAEAAAAEQELQKQQEFNDIHTCLLKLPVKYQEVITLRFFEKKQLHEISLILGKREGTVKSLLHRGLARLRELMPGDATF